MKLEDLFHQDPPYCTLLVQTKSDELNNSLSKMILYHYLRLCNARQDHKHATERFLPDSLNSIGLIEGH